MFIFYEISPPLQKLEVTQLVNEFLSPLFYGNWRFVTVFTRTPTGPYPEPDDSNPL
jgi:hypothetical protein